MQANLQEVSVSYSSTLDRWLARGCLALCIGLVACTDAQEPRVDAGGDAGDDLQACEEPSECVVVPESCCGSCGVATRGDAIAIARDAGSTHNALVCDDDVGCPDCDRVIDPTLVATCRAGRCALVDLLEHAASACEQDDDCHVRTPDCCPCGGDTSEGRLIGVSSENAYASLVCDSDRACPECAPIYPPEVTALCNADGHCEAEDTRLPGATP